MANNRPGTLIWCMGGTQHHHGNNNIRAYCVLQLALGNVGVAGGGTNIFRGHDNVQGATDLGCVPDPAGLLRPDRGRLEALGRVWDVDYDYLLGRFASKELMEAKGIPVSRWFDARARGQGEPRPADQRPRHGLHGPRAELADPPAPT